MENQHTYFRAGVFIEGIPNYNWTKDYHSVAGSLQKSHQWLGFPHWTEMLQLCFCTKPELFVSALASISGHLCMKTDSFPSTHSQLTTICIVSLYKRVIPSPLLWIRTREQRKKMLLWPTKALLEIILYDLRPFGREGIYCFDLIKAEKLIWRPVVKETNSHTKENSCDGIIQTIQVTLERKKGFSSKDLYSTRFATVEIKIIALYAYWKAVFNLEKAKCHIFFQLPDPILCWDHTHKHTYHLLPISKNHRKNHTEDV